MLSIMDVLHLVAFGSYVLKVINPNLLASVCMKTINFTMKYGLSKYSDQRAFSFAVVICNMELKSSYVIGKLSLWLLEKSKAKDMMPIVKIAFFIIIHSLFVP